MAIPEANGYNVVTGCDMATISRGRVLVVDADPKERGSHARVLGEAGFEVRAAPSGNEARLLLAKERFDAALGDVSASAKDVTALLRDLRRHTKDLPVVLLSSAAGASRAATHHVAVEVLKKPVAPGTLRRAAERAVRLGKRLGALTSFRNHRGEAVEVPEVTATNAKNEFGRVLAKATHDGIVLITRRHEPEAVLLSIDEFKELASARERKLDALSGEFDALLEKMQRPAARAGMKAAFDATPTRMGEAAVAAARKRG
jgi:prevent-host-death family protein